MKIFEGRGGVRPSRATSWVAATVGIGMILAVVMFFVGGPFVGGAVFMLVSIVAACSIVGYHIWNATSRQGANHTQFDFQLSRDGQQSPNNFNQQLRDLESLRKDNLISEEEYRIKRKQIMDADW